MKVIEYGGILARLTISVGSFYAEHHAWPTHLKTSRDFWETLTSSHLTPSGAHQVKARLTVQLVEEPIMCMVVSDTHGRMYNYYDNEPNFDFDADEVRSWLGVE